MGASCGGDVADTSVGINNNHTRSRAEHFAHQINPSYIKRIYRRVGTIAIAIVVKPAKKESGASKKTNKNKGNGAKLQGGQPNSILLHCCKRADIKHLLQGAT